jgi:hypothetical protein
MIDSMALWEHFYLVCSASFVRRISTDQTEWGEDKIAEEFEAKFGIPHSPSTIRRYMVRRTDGPRKTQT